MARKEELINGRNGGLERLIIALLLYVLERLIRLTAEKVADWIEKESEKGK